MATSEVRCQVSRHRIEQSFQIQSNKNAYCFTPLCEAYMNLLIHSIQLLCRPTRRMTSLTFLYPCIPLCFMLWRTSVELKHTHMCISSCHMLYIVITIFTHMTVRTSWRSVILWFHRFIPIPGITFRCVNLTMIRVIPEFPLSMVYTHMADTTVVRLSCF